MLEGFKEFRQSWSLPQTSHLTVNSDVLQSEHTEELQHDCVMKT